MSPNTRNPIHLVRLRFIDWLERIRDHAAKHLVEKLRAHEAHSYPGFGLGDSGGVRVHDRGGEAKVDNAVYASRLGEQVNEYGGLVGVSYLPSLGAGYEFAPGFNHDLISHQNLPFSEALRLLEASRGVHAA